MAETIELTLSDFLLARITEDEEVARTATSGPWEWTPEDEGGDWTDNGPWLCTVAERYHHVSDEYPTLNWTGTDTIIGAWGHDAWGISVGAPDMAHIARHDPARVLADVEAKRRIVERFVDQVELCGLAWDAPEDRLYPEYGGGYLLGLREAVQELAAVYAAHPDFREEWRA